MIKRLLERGSYHFGPNIMSHLGGLIKQLKTYHTYHQRLMQHRNELHIHSNDQLFEIRELRACLKWYVEHDDTHPHDEYYMAGHNRAKKILRMNDG